MSNGFGAGFFALSLLLALAAFAVLSAVTGLVAMHFRRRSGRVPRVFGYVVLLLFAGVVVVTGFGALALADEVSVIAVLLVVIVVAPFVAVGVYARRRFGLAGLDVVVTTTLAWCLPYVLGVFAFFVIGFGINQLLGLAPGEARDLGVAWYATVAAGLLATVTALGIGTRVSRLAPFFARPGEKETVSGSDS